MWRECTSGAEVILADNLARCKSDLNMYISLFLFLSQGLYLFSTEIDH